MLKMQSVKKKILIIILCLGILAGVSCLIYIIFIPHHKVAEQKLFEYTLEPQLTYEVHLLKNDIYESLILKENEIYMTNLIDYFQIDYSTLYTASEAVPLEVEYELMASVIGYNSDKDNRTDYWKRDFPLSEKKIFKETSKKILKNESIILSLKDYNEFAEKANEVTGINLSSELIISMVGSINAKTEYGVSKAPFNINISVPLLGTMVTVKKSDLNISSDKLTKSYDKLVPVNIVQVVLVSIVTVLLVMLLILSVQFIKEPTYQDLLSKEIRKLLKKYGSRMVALADSPNRRKHNNYEVNSMKDLILISDDIQKPIYYVKDKDDIVKDSVFYVDDSDNTYTYRHSNHFYNKLLYNLDDEYTELLKYE